MTRYTDYFFDQQETGSRRSATIVLPRVMEWLAPRRPARVVDLGCGVGPWLAVCRDELGIAEVWGVDGPYVSRARLLISPERFVAADLTRPLPATCLPTADLALSLEVGEHLPERAAQQLVASLCTLAPVVLFGAAIPYQPGTAHINGQWPAYWATLFREQGYRMLDVLRDELWDDNRVDPWYIQNAILYVCNERLGDYPRLAEAAAHCQDKAPLARVHPRMWDATTGDLPSHGLRRLLPAVGEAVRRTVHHRRNRLKFQRT